MSDQKKKFEAGDKVTWMNSSSRGSSISLSAKEGTIRKMDGDVATISCRGNNRRQVMHTCHLTHESEKNQVTRIFEAMAGAEVGSRG